MGIQHSEEPSLYRGVQDHVLDAEQAQTIFVIPDITAQTIFVIPDITSTALKQKEKAIE